MNFDERRLEKLITPKTKAFFVVHYAGIACEMDMINQIASKYGIHVVEDNAHGLFGSYKGKNLGTFGVLATQSFHETKNVSTGEGGALLVNDLKLEAVSYTHLRAHETPEHLVCRLLLDKKKKQKKNNQSIKKLVTQQTN